MHELLAARGAEAALPRDEDDRYWREMLPAAVDFATGCAVGAHAERMRLARIEAIVDDTDAPADVRAVFARILPEERFHARAFASLAGTDALNRTEHAQSLGERILGLRP